MEVFNEIMSRHLERIYPYFFPLVIAVWFWSLEKPFPKGAEILSASITLGAIFVGFLATSQSIVISLQSAKMELLKKTKYFPLLLTYLQEAIFVALAYCVLCLGAFFSDLNHPLFWFGPVWIFLTGATLLTFLRIAQNLMHIICNV
ncbi:MAG: hypothetical protein WCD79_19590, partial [Chthoniobacteraceae bacterium]